MIGTILAWCGVVAAVGFTILLLAGFTALVIGMFTGV